MKRKLFLEILFLLLTFLATNLFPRKTYAQSFDYCLNVPVLLYHHIQPYEEARQKDQVSLTVDNGVFEQQMAYLSAKGYKTISADTLVNSLKTHSPLPPKPILLTFDDGYMDNYTYAYPILRKYNLTGNIMVVTGLMENNDMLGWAQLKEMVASNTFFAYNHTWSHAPVGSVSQAKAQSEIITAKTQLEQYLGRTSNIFTYPYGSSSASAVSLLSQNGFSGAFSTIPGFTQCASFIMNLHRNYIGNSPLSYYGL